MLSPHIMCPLGAGAPSSPPPFSPLSIHFLIFCSFLLFPFFPFLICFTYFLLLSIHSLSTRIVSHRFQARGRRRQPNLGLVCCLFCVICIAQLRFFFVVFSLVQSWSCGGTVVFPCCRRQHNNLNEPLDPFPFFGWLLNKKAARLEVNILLAFLHWVRG